MANLNRWDPLQDALTLREAMNQLLEDSFVNPTNARTGQGFVPALDLSENKDAFLIEAAVPGLKPEDLEITFENGVLTIKGQVRQENEENKRHFHRIERRFGSFQRTINLPTAVKPDAINANLTNGVLQLEIPKAEEVKPRRVTVNVSPSAPVDISKN